MQINYNNKKTCTMIRWKEESCVNKYVYNSRPIKTRLCSKVNYYDILDLKMTNVKEIKWTLHKLKPYISFTFSIKNILCFVAII